MHFWQEHGRRDAASFSVHRAKGCMLSTRLITSSVHAALSGKVALAAYLLYEVIGFLLVIPTLRLYGCPDFPQTSLTYLSTHRWFLPAVVIMVVFAKWRFLFSSLPVYFFYF